MRPLVFQAPGQHSDKTSQEKEHHVPSWKIILNALGKEIALSAHKTGSAMFEDSPIAVRFIRV